MSWSGAVFAASAGFTIYVLFGYPLLLALLARLRHRPVKKDFAPRTVSVLLPVHNGERWIRDKLESILDLDYPPGRVRILVVSDGSTDGTEAIVEAFGERGVELVRIPRGGKAAALNAALARASGEILFFTDVRQRLSRSSLRELVACFGDATVGAASGELTICEGESQEETNVGLYWKYETWIRKRLSRLDSVLGATGCIYAMRRELAVPLPAECLLDDVYLPLEAFFRGYRVILEEKAKAFDYPTSLGSEFRRKVRTLAGVYQLVRSRPELLGPKNRMWIHFVSHKLGRLALPFALLAIAASSPFLPAPWGVTLLAAQAAFYLAAGVDLLIPENRPLKRLTSPVRTFVALMAASLCAASILFRPGAAFWKTTEVKPAARARKA